MIFRQLRLFGNLGQIWTLLDQKYSVGKKTEVRPRYGLKRTRVKILRVHLLETGVDAWTFVRKTYEIRVVAFNYLVSVYQVASTLGDKYYFILTLRSQIFEHLRETFCRRALGYLEQAA